MNCFKRPDVMMSNLRNLIWSAGILLCYPLYSAGQLYLFFSKQKEADFYTLINTYPGEWIVAHIFLLISLVLLVPAFIGLCAYFKNSRSYIFIQLSTFFIILSIFPLFGQFTIDLCIVDIFKLPEEQAYQVMDKVQGDALISALFYDNSKFFVLLKYADLTLTGQLLLGIALFVSSKVRVWTKVVFGIAFLCIHFGMLIDPFYGRLLKRTSYSLISVSLLPVAWCLLKGRSDSELLSKSMCKEKY